MYRYSLFVSYCWTLSNIFGTSVAIAWTDSAIVVGADSRTTSDDSTFIWTTCKIINIEDSITFVNAGIHGDYTGFNIPDIARNSFSGNRSFRNKMIKFKDTLTAELMKFGKRIGYDDVADSTFRKLNPSDCAVVLATKDSLILQFVSFSGFAKKDLPNGFFIAPVDYCLQTFGDTTVHLVGLGHRDVEILFRNLIKTYSPKILQGQLPQMIYSILDLESVLHPHNVAQPFDVVILERGKKPFWITPPHTESK